RAEYDAWPAHSAIVLCYLPPARGRRASASESQAAAADEPAGRAIGQATLRGGTVADSSLTRACSLVALRMTHRTSLVPFLKKLPLKGWGAPIVVNFSH